MFYYYYYQRTIDLISFRTSFNSCFISLLLNSASNNLFVILILLVIIVNYFIWNHITMLHVSNNTVVISWWGTKKNKVNLCYSASIVFILALFKFLKENNCMKTFHVYHKEIPNIWIMLLFRLSANDTNSGLRFYF